MSRVSAVVTPASTEPGDVLAARLRALLDAGWDMRLFCKGKRWNEHPALRDPALAERVEFATGEERSRPPGSLFLRPSWLLRYLRAGGEPEPFDARILQLRPDLVHFHSGTAARKGLRLGALLDCRLAVSYREDGRDLELPDPEPLWQRADLFLFADAAILERAAALGCPREKAEVLPYPLADAGPVGDGRPADPQRLRIISAGAVTWEQGFEHSVHAVRLLRDMGVDCEYRILGEGEHVMAVAFARHELGLVDHVHLVSRDGRGSLAEELTNADVFVDPAVTDTTSATPLITAGALGIPFVATGREGLPEDAGITVPRRNPRAIADALARLARDPALREQMAHAGRTRNAGLPTMDDHLRRLEDLYRRLLS